MKKYQHNKEMNAMLMEPLNKIIQEEFDSLYNDLHEMFLQIFGSWEKVK